MLDTRRQLQDQAGHSLVVLEAIKSACMATRFWPSRGWCAIQATESPLMLGVQILPCVPAGACFCNSMHDLRIPLMLAAPVELGWSSGPMTKYHVPTLPDCSNFLPCVGLHHIQKKATSRPKHACSGWRLLSCRAVTPRVVKQTTQVLLQYCEDGVRSWGPWHGASDQL